MSTDRSFPVWLVELGIGPPAFWAWPRTTHCLLLSATQPMATSASMTKQHTCIFYGWPALSMHRSTGADSTNFNKNFFFFKLPLYGLCTWSVCSFSREGRSVALYKNREENIREGRVWWLIRQWLLSLPLVSTPPVSTHKSRKRRLWN